MHQIMTCDMKRIQKLKKLEIIGILFDQKNYTAFGERCKTTIEEEKTKQFNNRYKKKNH